MFALLVWVRVAAHLGGVNSSSSIDRCDNDDSGNAQMTITTVAMTVVCGLYCFMFGVCLTTSPARWLSIDSVRMFAYFRQLKQPVFKSSCCRIKALATFLHITTVHSAINEYTARDSGGNVDE